MEEDLAQVIGFLNTEKVGTQPIEPPQSGGCPLIKGAAPIHSDVILGTKTMPYNSFQTTDRNACLSENLTASE